MNELQKDSIKLDDEIEKKVVKMVLRLLEDKNGEVQNQAVKCLGPVVNRVKEMQVEMIVDSLCQNMVSNDEQLRDISSIGLKTVISEMPQNSNSLAPNVCQRITGKLSNAIEKVTNRTQFRSRWPPIFTDFPFELTGRRFGQIGSVGYTGRSADSLRRSVVLIS